MTIVAPRPPAAAPNRAEDEEGRFGEELAAARRRWEAEESTRSGLTVFAIVIAGVALIASMIAVGFASTRTTAKAATAASAPVAAAADTTVSLAEYTVTLPVKQLTAGVKTLRISNSGLMQHEVLVFHPASSVDPNNLPVDANGNVVEDAPGVNKMSDGANIDPGQSQTRSIDLSQPGTYVFVCNLAGHYQLGMRTVVTVA